MSWALAGAGIALGLVLAPALARSADLLAAARGLEDARSRVRVPLLYGALPVLLGACGLRLGADRGLAIAWPLVAVVVLLALVDLEHRVIPNDVVLPAAVAALAARTATEPGYEWAIAAAAAGGFLLAAALISPAGLGMGDVKLGVLLGAALGRSVLDALVVAFALLLLAALGMLARQGRGGLKQALPFAPFLAAGGVAALLLRGG